jgi:hypothetical protein
MNGTTKEPKYRKQLNPDQLKVLELLLRFRFGTTELLARALGKRNGTIIKSRLSILREQGYIDRHYQGTDRLLGKHAAYYITAKGVRTLNRKDDEQAIKKSYKDKKASRQFIDHNLAVFAVFCRLHGYHGDTLRFFTKVDLADYDYFPQPLPDAFLSYTGDNGTKRYFLEVFGAATPNIALYRRIKQLIDYYESGEWEATDSDFPVILLFCETPSMQNRAEKRVLTALRYAEADDLTIALTNPQALDASASWRVAGDDSTVSLLEL